MPMKTAPVLYGALICLALLVPIASRAESGDSCNFNPPSPLLLPKAYAKQAFRSEKDNRAVEFAQIDKDVGLEIHLSQCADFIIAEFILILPRDAGATRDKQYWLDFAAVEIGRLKTKDPQANADLLAFLKKAATNSSRRDIFSACRDGSFAEAGQCSWDSLGGFIFEVRATPSAFRISATRYVSG